MKRVLTMTFKNLPTATIERKAELAVFYHEKDIDTLPAKYLKGLGTYYEYMHDRQQGGNILCNTNDNSPVLANQKQAEAPKLSKIMGNTLHASLFRGSVKKFEVMRIKKVLNSYFSKQMSIHKPKRLTEFPVLLELKFYIDLSNKLMDEDGIRFFYDKIFRDRIQDLYYVKPEKRGDKAIITPNPFAIMKRDSIEYIFGSKFQMFHHTGEPYMIVNIYNFDNDTEMDMERRNIEYEKASPITPDVVLFAEALTKHHLKANSGADYQTVYDVFFNILSECQR